jgi:hypothetical protein
MNTEEKNSKDEDNGKNKKDDIQSSINSPVKGSIKEQEESEKLKKSTYDKVKNYFSHLIPGKNTARGIGVWLNITMLIAFIIFGWIQSRQTQTVINDAEKNMKRSDSANRDALKLTKKADSLADESLKQSIKTDLRDSILAIKDTLARDRNTKTELRAYLEVNKFILSNDLLGQYAGIHVSLHNIGKTPAYNVSIADTEYFDFPPINDNVSNAVVIKPHQMIAGIVGIDSSYITCPSHLMLYPGVWEDIRNKKRTYYILGHMTYEDIFKQKHFTMFCVFMNVFDYNTMRFSTYWKYNKGD